MVAQISDGKLSLGGLFNGLRVQVDQYESIIKKFSELDFGQDSDLLVNGKADWEAIAKAIGTTDARAIGYFKTLDNGKGTIDNSSASIEGMSEYLKKTGQAFDFAALKAGLLNAALNAGIMLAFSLAVKAVTEAWDEYNYTVEESQQNIDEINDKIKDLTQQLDELNSIEDKSQYDEKKIGYLQQELDLQERLLEIEQKRYYQNLIGTSFSDNFDKDSLVSKQGAEYNHNNKNNLENLTRRATNYINDVELYNQKIIEAEQNVENGLMTQEDVNNIIKKRTDLLSDQENIEDQLLTNMAGYLENEQSAQEALDSGLLTGKDLEKAQEMVTYWHQMYVDSLGLLENVQKVSGTYDDTKDRLTLKFGKIDPNDFDTLTDEEKRIALTLEPDADIDFDELKSKIEEKLNNPPIDVDIETSPISNLSDYLDQESMTEIKKSLLELAKSGEISEETFNSTEEYRKLLTDLGMDAEEASERLKEMASEDSDMEDWQKQLQSARTSIEELTKIKSSISSSGITSDSLDTIISKYPELLAYSDDMQGMLSAIDNLLYEQKDAAQVAGDALLDYSTVIYGQVVSSIYEDCANANSNLINELAQGYNIDLNNFSSLAQAKEAIDTQLLQTLMEMWGKYYGIVVDSVTGLASVTQNLPDFYQNEEAQNQLATYNQIITKLNATKDKFENGLDFGSVDSASSVGKSAGDAYLEAFEKELGDLDDLKDRGVISEKEYLDRLRELYQRYFKDKEKYVDQYQKYEKKYLDGMYSLYNSALSGITKLMGKQIDAYSEEKESVVSALEEERDARLAVIDAQKEQLQSQIDLIEKQIDEKQKEIDAINDAADARKRELDLQKAQYELERARNQRTILQYSEEKGMHYVKDDSAERDAKEKVDDAKREIQIAAIEKEIDLLNEKKDLIQEQIDLLDKQADEVESYYSKMIESTEKYYDSLIKSMENQKSKWEELADIKEVADAYSAVQQVFGDLGYTVEDVLSGNEQAFEDFRNKYISLMNDMNSNSSFGDGLSYATGKAKEDLGSFLDSTNEVADGLDNLSEKSSAVDGVATSLGNVSTSASELSTNTNGLSDNLNGISDSLNNFPTEDKFSGLTTQFIELGKAIGEVAKALGIDGEGSVNSLVTALSGISEISLGDEQTGVIAQFNALASAVNAVSSAINGTGGGASNDPQDSKSQSMSAGATGTSGSITSALDELKAKADEVLGTGGGEDSAGEGTIGQFEQLEQAVKDVSTAIGSGGGKGEESGGKSNGEEDADNLIGAITSLGEQSEETLGKFGGEGVIGRFEQFKDVIGEANEHITGISDGLDAIDGKEVECTITVNIKQNGSLPAGFGAWTGTAMNLESGSYNAKYGKGLVDGTAHVEGTAKVTGDWGVHQGGQALLGELGREIIVRQGRFFTVGENGAEMHNLQPGDIVFNHVQTEELLKNGHISSRGKAYANGTVNKPSVLDRLRAQGYEVQKYEWKDMYGNLISPQQMNEAAKAWVSGTYECLTPMNDFKEKIKETVKVIEGANVVNNTMNQQPISVTMGDIHLHEVQDVDGLSKAIIHQMPGKMLQAIHQK